MNYSIDNTEKKPVRLLYVPEFLLPSFKIAGVTKLDLSNMSIDELDKRAGTMSKYDMEVMKNFNSMMYGHFTGNSSTTTGNAKAIEIKNSTMNILYEINTEDVPCEFIAGNEGIAVICKPGFTNFMVLNDSEREYKFITDFLNFTFKHFKEEVVYSTSYFRNFIKANVLKHTEVTRSEHCSDEPMLKSLAR